MKHHSPSNLFMFVLFVIILLLLLRYLPRCVLKTYVVILFYDLDVEGLFVNYILFVLIEIGCI
jgi:hypothetical protein